MRAEAVRDGILGVCVGDALGVPVEFESRWSLDRDPVLSMRGYGTHNQPPGTWSDDSSLMLCLADSLCKGYSLDDIGKHFQLWLERGLWTPHGYVFDIGITTQQAIRRLGQGVPPVQAGGRSEQDNGNGSLMRILPMVYGFAGQTERLQPGMAMLYDTADRIERIHAVQDVSCLTHAHPRSQLCCVLYVEMGRALLAGASMREALDEARRIVLGHYKDPEYTTEFQQLQRILYEDIQHVPKDDIKSTGYVVHTLEASLWCLLRHDNLADTLLEAVNLGEDTDTTGAVAGGLAGLAYGWKSIPSAWLSTLARLNDLIDVSDRLQATLGR